jgi:hypothetical protein
MSSLYSSNGSSDEDELSKLIGKRSQIKRQKAVDVEEAVKSLEPTVDLDLDKLPNFKTERPVRKNRPKRDEEKEESPKGKSQKEEESPIVDFMAEYEDEVRTVFVVLFDSSRDAAFTKLSHISCKQRTTSTFPIVSVFPRLAGVTLPETLLVPVNSPNAW